MFIFPEIVPRNVNVCGSRDHERELYVIIFLDIIPPPRIRPFRKFGC